MISLRRHACGLAVAVACWALGAQARADDARPTGSDGGAANPMTVERAQQLLHDGNEMFWAGRFSEALQTFEDAHRLYPSPKVYFNIARCEGALDRHARALTHYQQFLHETHEGNPQIRAEAERQVTALIPTVARLELRQVPANAGVSVDGESVGLTPIEEPLWVEPGAHRLSIELAGRPPWIGTVEGKAGDTIAVDIPAPEAATTPARPPSRGEGATRNDGNAPPPRSPEPTEPSHLRRWWWLWAGIGVALIGGATAIYLSTRCPVSKGVCE